MPALPASDPTAQPLSSTEQTGAYQIAALIDQMRTKDTLVEQLTERLEAAAEQLDRLQRSGADRGRPGSGGGSRELIEQTGQLTSRVEEALESWGQSSSHFEVIMQRLNEIGDYISHPSDGHEPKPASKPAAGLFQAPSGGASSVAAAAGSAPPAKSTSGPGQGSFWEKMKASMIDGTPAPALPTAKAAVSPAPTSASSYGAADRSPEDQPDPMEGIAPAPTMIDIDNASIEELREAVNSRDNYISTLITELRNAHTLPLLPEDFANSGLGPEDLLTRLIDLESRFTSGIQRENLELSLERARMGRERVRLDQVKAQLEGQIKRLAAAASEKSDEMQPSGVSAEPSVAEGKLSWLKRLQPKKSTA